MDESTRNRSSRHDHQERGGVSGRHHEAEQAHAFEWLPARDGLLIEPSMGYSRQVTFARAEAGHQGKVLCGQSMQRARDLRRRVGLRKEDPAFREQLLHVRQS
jgi:hypothetical protein